METEDEVKPLENIDSTNDGENVDSTNDKPDEGSADDAEELKKKNKQLFERAKKAEGELKALKSKGKGAESTSGDYLTRDEAILLAKGIDLEDMDQLKLIQKATGSSLKEAMENPLYQGYIKNKEAEIKRNKAQLGAAGGESAVEKEFNKPNLTPEEHRALWEKKYKG